MKKLLLVLLVVTLASFLFVGCLPTTPPAEGEGEGEGEAEICPIVAVTSQVEVAGKAYIKGGKQTITVTFAVPTEPVSVYVGDALKMPLATTEVVMYANADKTVYTGTFTFSKAAVDDCNEAYIYVETCETCAYCKYPYTVDTVAPEATVEICLADCTCAGCEIVFSSDVETDTCDPDEVLCDDACSGFASWSIDIYDRYPFDECCLVPCYEPIETGSGVCPIDFTTTCLTDGLVANDVVYAVVTLVDNVGNSTRFGADIEFNPDTCDELTVTPWAWQEDGCTDTPDFVVCPDTTKLTTTLAAEVTKPL